MHTVEIPQDQIERIALKISENLESKHEWYADYKNEKYHYIIYRNKIFKIDRTNPKEYQAAKNYGLALDIPDYQVNFSPEIEVTIKN